ncbi:MAG: hypothetical protein NXI20_25125 [bacterium]|nr:hypothetical protein [bacterium]
MNSLEIYSSIEELKSDRKINYQVSKKSMDRRRRALEELNKKFSISLMKK